MTLEEAIIHAEEVADEKMHEAESWEMSSKHWGDDKNSALDNADQCRKCAEEHRQLAEWLKELKELKDKNTPKELVKDYDGGYKSGWLRCPSCFYILGGFNEKLGVVAINHNANNCLSCGQAIKHHE